MKLKMSILAILSLLAFGCHAPVKRAAKTPVDPSAANAKKSSVACDMQGTFLTALKTKHPDLTGLLTGQMRPVAIAGVSVNHFVATFSASLAAPAPSSDPAPAPAPAPASPAAPAQVMMTSAFIDPTSCAIDGYEEAAVTPDVDKSVTTCDNPEKAMGTDGQTKQFAFITYDDSFKSPYVALMGGSSLFEVYSISTADDGTQSLTQYFFDQSPCHISFPEKVTLSDPSATAKAKKGGS